MKHAYLCVISKNEGKDLAEWVLYHLFLGFKKIIVYDNGSTDSTKELIHHCMKYGDIEYIFWPSPFSQIAAYKNCLEHFGRGCDWMAFLDVDEFIVLPQHKYLEKFLVSIDPYQAVGIHWRMFGSSGEKSIENKLVTTTFLNRAIDTFSANRHIKSIVRPESISKVLNPHFFLLKRLSWFSLKRYDYVDAKGNRLYWLKPGKAVDTGSNDVAVINHYFTKSEEHYQKKLQRGNADKSSKRMDAFNYNNRNEIFDAVIMDLYAVEIEKIKNILASFDSHTLAP